MRGRSSLSNWISYDTRAGEPYQLGDVTLTPFARSLEIRFPGLMGGFEWSRPSSVLVQTRDGGEEIIRVHDLTRILQLSILVSGLIGGLAMLISGRNRKSKQEKNR